MAAAGLRAVARDVEPGSICFLVAHRKEILEQSQATFCHALRDASFGEQWVAGQRPQQYEHVFASVQSLANVDLADLEPEHFDVVIIDEFHHAAAPSYERLLEHLRPQELLGLTATPERSDGLPVLNWFGDRIAAELRLWDAIDHSYYLSPFPLLRGLRRLGPARDPVRGVGVGYDVEGLTNLYTSSDAWARRGDPGGCGAWRRTSRRCGRWVSASAWTTASTWLASSPRLGFRRWRFGGTRRQQSVTKR